MYKKHDTYLINQKINVPDSTTTCRLISNKFMSDGIPFLQERATAQNCILFFAYANQYITYEELTEFLGPYFSTPRIRQNMRILIDKKFIRKEYFTPTEGLSRNAYCLTRQGISYVLPLLPHTLTRNIKPRRSGKVVPLHDYYTGMSLMHFFLSPLFYHWDKEVVYSNKLRPDVVLYFDGISGKTGSSGNQNHKVLKTDIRHLNTAQEHATHTFDLPSRLFIEEDMGTENKYELLGKLDLYHSLGLTQDSVVIFSMARPLRAPAPASGLARPFIKKLLHIMETCGEASCYQVYEDFLCKKEVYTIVCQEYDPTAFLNQFEEFLVWTGVCRSMGTPVSAMRAEHLNRYDRHDFSYKELLQYAENLSGYSNPYIQIYMNQSAAVHSFHKYCALLEAVFADIANASWTTKEYLQALFDGFPVYVMPTKLLSNYFPHIFPITYGTVVKYYKSISAYYPQLKENTPEFSENLPFHIVSEPLQIYKDFPFLTLHNCFSLPNSGFVYIASAYNMAYLAQIRLLYDSRYASEARDKQLHFILIVDEYEHALQLQKMLASDTYLEGPAYHDQKRPVSVMFLLSRDCGKPERLFSVHEYRSIGQTRIYREPIFLIPSSYQTTDGSIHPAVSRKLLQRSYDIPGYGDIDLPLADEIAENEEI